MKNINDKQNLEWKEDLIKHKARLQQAQQVVDEQTRLILMIEGGIQYAEMLQRKIESSSPSSNKVGRGKQLKTEPLK